MNERVVPVGMGWVSDWSDSAATANELLVTTLRRCAEAASRQGGGETDEILDYQIVLTNPVARITTLSTRPLTIVSAVARFVWMVSHSNRLADIAFYEPKVSGYTDDGLSVPGSDYGQRIFQPAPNLDQVEGVISRLREDLSSRRAAVVIWQPGDAVRQSTDIPCAFGAFYHVRDGKLIATTIMRSNNAFRLLPFNVFEFSLVAEMIASEVGVELGTYVHFAASMHVIESERARARSVLEEAERTNLLPNAGEMSRMPAGRPALRQARELCKLESKLRHDHAGVANSTVEELLREPGKILDPYWLAFYQVLLSHALARANRIQAAEDVATRLPAYFRGGVLRALDNLPQLNATSQLTLESSFDPKLETGLQTLDQAFAPTASETNAAVVQLLDHIQTIERRRGSRLSIAVIKMLHDQLVVRAPIRIAARSEGHGSSLDRNNLSLQEVESALSEIERSQQV